MRFQFKVEKGMGMEQKAVRPAKTSKKPSLAQWLRELRVRVGYSQQDVASILNMSRSTYTYYETGRTVPDPMTLHRIARIFNVPIEVFFSTEDPDSIFANSDPPPCKPRAMKKQRFDPQHIGELTAEEKQIIAFLRDKELSAEAVIQALRNRFDNPKGKSV